MRTTIRIAIAALFLGTSAVQATAQTATWYISTYTDEMLVWDEASEEIIDRIQMNRIIPNGVQLNETKTRLYVGDASAEFIQVVDVASREVIEEHSLSEGDTTFRIGGFAPHPSETKAVIFGRRHTKLADRYLVEGPFILEYDMSARAVTDTIPWPDGEERDRVAFRYSPDGETLYFYTNDIIAVDSDSYEEIDRWEVSNPLEPGLGRPSFSTNSQTYDEAGVATNLMRMQDPVHNRTLMGIAKVRLSEKAVDFYTVGPSEPVSAFAMAPGGQKAYALYTTIEAYEFWEFDLVEEVVTRRVPFAGRPRMGLDVSADGTKLYVHVAGNTIDVYDTETFSLLRTVEFDEDMTLGNIAIIPGVE
ncbi:MAG: YncE family protein [Longimicrobiales bacterium]